MLQKILIIIFFIKSSVLISQNLSLIFPSNNYTSNDSNVTFKWNSFSQNNKLLIATNPNFTSLIVDTLVDTSSITLQLQLNKNYFWKIINNEKESNTYQFSLIKPTDWRYSSWYTANDNTNNSNNISKLTDKIDSFDLVQENESYQPYLDSSSLFSSNIVFFNNENRFLKNNTSIKPAGYIVVLKINKIPSFSVIYSHYNQDNGLYILDNKFQARFNNNPEKRFFIDTVDTSYYIVGIKAADSLSETKIYFQNNITPIGYNETLDSGVYNLGSRNGTYGFRGNIFELFVFYNHCSDSIFSLSYNYLRYKYAPPVNLGYDIHIPYGFCDTSIDAGSRFTKYRWSTGDTSQRITVNHEGYYAVTVTDIFGFESSDSIYVDYQTPHLLNDTTICLGDTIWWHTQLDSSYQFTWSTGDSISAIPIWEANTYALTVTDSLGCHFVSDSVVVEVDSFSLTISLGPDTTLCKGASLSLKNGQENAIHYAWSTGDTSAFITIDTAGKYTLTVTDRYTCQATDSIRIAVHGQNPVVNFSWENSCLGDSTLFFDSSYSLDESHIVSWHWSFDSLSSDTLQTSVFQFPRNDTFLVTLQISTDSQCTAQTTKPVIIHPLPKADFSYSQLCHKQTITFSSTSSSLDSIKYYQWVFNYFDTTTNHQTTHYQFDTTGSFPVSLLIETVFGCMGDTTKYLEVKESPHTQFSYSTPCEKTPIYFSDNTTISPTFSIIERLWHFGDEETSTEEYPMHQFAHNGHYTVVLQTKSVNGCSTADTQDVTVYARPQTHFQLPVLCSQTPLLFQNTSSIETPDSLIAFKWYINQNFQSADIHPYFTFADSGKYRLTLIAISSHQCADTLDTNLNIAPRPDASFSLSTHYPTPGEAISFSCNKEAEQYIWTISQSHYYTASITHSFADTGSYPLQLIVENAWQCYDTSWQSIHVVPSYYDLILYRFEATPVNNYLNFRATIINASPKPVTAFDIILDLQGSPSLKQHFSDTLWPNDIKTYQLATQYNTSSKGIPYFICASAIPTYFTDRTPDNNQQCLSLSTDFSIFPPYPNPTTSHTTIRFVLPHDGACELKLISRNGKLCWQQHLNGTQGLNTFNLDLSTFEAGSYTLFIYFSNLVQKQQIIKK